MALVVTLASSAFLGVAVAADSAEIWLPSSKLVGPVTSMDAQLGSDVAIGEGFVAVGVPGDATVSVFSRDSGVQWPEGILHGPRGFGGSVAASMTTLVVGAPGANQVHVFENTQEGWSDPLVLQASEGRFGTTVAISEDGRTLAVGAPGETTTVSHAGAIHVYEEEDGTWAQTARLVATDPQRRDSLGWDVAVDELGTRIVGGSLRGNGGAALVFEEEGGSGWDHTTTLTSASFGSGFGRAVSVSGATVAVGAPFAETTELETGAVFLFAESEGTWVKQAVIAPSDAAVLEPTDGLHFGLAVELHDSTLVIGAPRDDASPESPPAPTQQADAVCFRYGWLLPHCNRPGAAYVFEESDGSWHQTAKLTSPDGAPRDKFGTAVDVSIDRCIAVGAPDHIARQTEAGAAYTYCPAAPMGG